MWRNRPEGYGLVAIVLHWLMALVIVALFAVGLWMVDLTYYSPWYQQAPALHKSSGMVMMALLLLRLGWRIVNPSPRSLPNHHPLEQLGAKLGHVVLYVGIGLVLLSGYLISTADGRGIEVFGLFTVPAIVTGIDQQEEIAGTVHFYGAWALILAAAGHGLAALKHHFIDKDSTLKRMLKPI